MRNFFLSFLTIVYLVSAQWIGAQGTGTWTSYLSYYNTTLVAEGNTTVYAVANGSLYSYGKEDGALTFYSRENGLNDNDITAIGYNENVDKLLIVYSNGNMDILSESGAYNLPYVQTTTNIQDKTLNEIYFHDEYAYLSLNSAIVVVNLSKNEITDTYRLGKTINATAILGNQIYAATDEGMLIASTSDNLLDSSNWSEFSLSTTKFDASDITKMEIFGNRLCLFIKGNGIYYLDNDNTPQNLCVSSSLKGMNLQGDKLLAYTSTSTYIFTSLTAYTQVATGTTNDIACINTSDTYWVAAGSDGLLGMKLSNGEMEVEVYGLISLEDSPKYNYCDFMTFQQGKLWVAGGGRWSDRYNRPAIVSSYADGVWSNLDEDTLATVAKTTIMDVTSIAVDPNDPNHYFASTWGEGVLEFQDGEFVTRYNASNSTLESATTWNAGHYIRVEGLCYDSEGNLWMTNTATSSCINVLKADGTWVALQSTNYNDLYDQYVVDKILITQDGYKWVNILRGDVGIVVFDDNGTIDDVSDDTVNKFSSFNLNSASGETISVSGYYCMAEDKDGDIWIGTDRGPIICPVPERAISSPSSIYCTRIVRSLDDDEDISSYFLYNTKVTAIAVDGGNRKWIGTEGSGVFLISADGSETIESFTTEDSPLPSDNILSIAIDSETGEVFIGTENGIVSYVSDASEGREDYSEVYAYPNPVRPEYEDKVTITGLMEDSNIKITDIKGNLIYQATSNGGTLTWNCHNRSGKRVASGVYLVLASTPEGKESVVTKIMVIR